MSNLYQDPNWPRASAWLAGESGPKPVGRFAVVGAGVCKGSITPGRCDLAPAAIRKALERFSLADLYAGHDLSRLKAHDAGDLDVASLTGAQMFEPVRNAVTALCRESTAVAVLGGDNSITRPGVHALGVPLDRCGLITFDAHLDLRDLGQGYINGNPVRALLEDGLPPEQCYQIGLQSFANSHTYAAFARESGLQTYTIEDVMDQGIHRLVHNVIGELGSRVDRIYVNFDMDVLDRAYSPATPGSRPGGLTPFQLRRAAYLCGLHHRVHIADFVEIDPEQDINGITSLAAAACLLEFASGVLTRFEGFSGHT